MNRPIQNNQRRSFRRPPRRRSGIILLVVLGSLTFFSLLVVTYFVFSTQSQQSAFGMNARTTRAPDINGLMDEAMLTLLRGTSDVQSGFFGESLLDDYYGHRDGFDMQAHPGQAPFDLGKGIVRLPISQVATSTRAYSLESDDLLTGRLITFEAGPLRNKTFPIIRSLYPTATAAATYDNIYIEVDESDWSPTSSVMLESLFYADPTNLADGYHCRLNGIPQNSRGLGYDSTTEQLDETVHTAGLRLGRGFADLPVSLQPNQIRSLLAAGGSLPDKSRTPGDFDERYDAPDMLNWWLSYRHADGTVIPSFHRPAVMNYILNEVDWSSATDLDYADAVASLARATMRPIPIAEGQLQQGNLTVPASPASNARFTGGNGNFALRTALLMRQANGAARLNQLANALITSFDVDNDGDGRPDSVWIDLNLPVITSREGKLLRPMIAVMIEDLGGRLNVNAVGNSRLVTQFGNLRNANAMWAESRDVYQNAANVQSVFRGLGYGPADMMIPTVRYNNGMGGRITGTNVLTNLQRLITERYGPDNLPGADSATPATFAVDGLDNVRLGYRPLTHNRTTAYGRSLDPFGRGGAAIGMSGDLVLSNAGEVVRNTAPFVNEGFNDPYELDPTGRLAGDEVFTLAELDAVLRAGEFSSDLLPQRLRDRLQFLIDEAPEFSRAVTTTSVSADAPPTFDEETPLLGFVERMFDIVEARTGTRPTLTQAQLETFMAELVPPEFRLGRKLDVNRPFGNGIDDDMDGLIDEPGEVESSAFGVAGQQTLPTGFASATPDYNFDSSATDGRQLLARNLYTLMMVLTEGGVDFPSVGSTAFSAADAQLYKARRLAQWAVNVVDYRDADVIMTRFAFDPNPFDGWTPPAGAQHVVWGVEAPEMVFSETIGLHDTRVVDGSDDDGSGDMKGGGGGDANSDSVRKPEGSLIMELLCTHPTTTDGVNTSGAAVNDDTTQPSFPQELYTATGEIDLARTNPQGVPVWRIAISEPHPAGSPKVNQSPLVLRDAEPGTAALVPDARQLREIDAAVGNDLDLERFIWFPHYGSLNDIATVITNAGITDMAPNEVFFAPLQDLRENKPMNPGVTDRVLAPGQFLTLAPREVTHLGSRRRTGPAPAAPSHQRFDVNVNAATGPTGLIHFRQQAGAAIGPRLTPVLGSNNSYTPALPLIVATHRPPGWPAAAFEDGYVGLNVSEPMPNSGSYYPLPMTTYDDPTIDNDGFFGPDYPLLDAYFRHDDAMTFPSRDEPVDNSFGLIPTVGQEPDLGTVENYRTAYLQRLANPMLPYNSVTNPYRSIDWMTIDLTVFSGEEVDTNVNPGTPTYATSSRQRNGHLRRFDSTGTAQIDTNQGVLFSYETSIGASEQVVPSPGGYFSFAGNDFVHNSFSFLNTAEAVNPGFNGFSNSVGSQGAANITTNDRNAPTQPYAKHPWLNRPFASHLELMMVPACSQARLFEEFSVNTSGDPAVYPVASAAGTEINSEVFNATFGHLLNFFHSSENEADAAQFTRLFDFVHTLPRFRGEVDMITPSQLTNTNMARQNELDLLKTLLEPPFNMRYDNLRQGRVNLNTLAEFPVWAGVMHGHLHDRTGTTDEFISPSSNSQLSFDRFIANRRGYDVDPPGTMATPITGMIGMPPMPPMPGEYNYDETKLDPRFPTQFAGVFKSAADAPLAPVLRDPVDTDTLRRREVNGTLLRGSGTLDANDGATPIASQLFVRDSGDPVASGIHRDRDRNPYLRYQTLMRMPNLVSDNSQVYLMRMTMGFFEVDANDPTSVGREYNADSGQNQRYRATFIIDRSRPVGFRPGEDLNVRDAVIFESYDQ